MSNHKNSRVPPGLSWTPRGTNVYKEAVNLMYSVVYFLNVVLEHWAKIIALGFYTANYYTGSNC